MEDRLGATSDARGGHFVKLWELGHLIGQPLRPEGFQSRFFGANRLKNTITRLTTKFRLRTDAGFQVRAVDTCNLRQIPKVIKVSGFVSGTIGES
jgi:hypothetical protein